MEALSGRSDISRRSMKNSAQVLDRPSASILIVDDHAAVRAGLRHLISSRAGWSICGEAADGQQAVSLALRLKPSVIVMDISMPGIDGLEATRRVREHLPSVEVLIVSQHDSEQVVAEAQKAGARGFVVKSHLSADLLPALEAALLHSSRISAPVSKAWQDAISSAWQPAREPFADPGPHDDLDLMSGGGEMGAYMRAHDWSRTTFGPVSRWPQSLRTALRICLDSRFPIVIWWGPELRLLYNDAWKPALGGSKHPQALGAPAVSVWSEVWNTIGPMLEGVMRTGQATWENDQLLLLNRDGYVEESYWTHSYSAIRLNSGEVGGVFSAVHEVTDRVLSDRRLKTLREVADQMVQAKNELDACTLAMQSIARNPADCPYALIFLCEAQKARRVSASFDAGKQVPSTFDLSNEDSWGIHKTLQTRATQAFKVIGFESLPGAPFGNKCENAISIPIRNGNREPIGVLTVGISPYRKLDGAYRDFLESLAKNLAANINKARAYELERKLRIDAQRLAAIVASSDDAIISKDLNGVITSWNKSAERIFGYTAEEALGQHITLIIPEERRAEEVQILKRLRQGERVDHFHTVRARKDGSSLDVSVTISPVRDSAGQVIGASKVARDITDLKHAEANARKLTETLEAEVRARTIELENRNAEVLRQSELLREFSRRLLQAQDEERRHIARELHDSAGQTLTVLGISVAQLVQKTGRNAPQLAAAAEVIQETVQQLHREIRTTSYLLHPPLLDENGLASALSWYIQGLAERGGLEIALDVSDEVGRLPRDLELVIFRLVQECLTNIHRHSGSKTAMIQIVRESKMITVEVKDQGRGMSSEKLAEIQSSGSGVGIRGMRERIRQFHGTLKIVSGASGTQIVVNIPVPTSTDSEAPGGIAPLQAAV
jgi:PAS domain S-box-containing protein